MRLSMIFVFVFMLACKPQNKNTDKAENTPIKAAEVIQSFDVDAVKTQEKNKDKMEKSAFASKSESKTQPRNMQCNVEVCLQLRNHNASNQSFEIYMINTVPVFGFQCDLPGISIVGSKEGLLQENEYQTSNSASRILSFSMQGRSIPAGGGVLTTINYSDPTKEVCMTGIIFAGIGGSKLINDIPECLTLN